MEIMIVLAFLFILLCTGVKHKSVQIPSKITKFAYDKWAEAVTDREFEKIVTDTFTRALDTDESRKIKEEYKSAEEMYPCCKKPDYHYQAKDWEIPIVLAIHGKLPSYQTRCGHFFHKGSAEHLRMYKWVESTLREKGIDVTLCETVLTNDPPKPVENIDSIKTSMIEWRGRYKNGKLMKFC